MKKYILKLHLLTMNSNQEPLVIVTSRTIG